MSHVLVMVTVHADGNSYGTSWHRGDIESCERVRSMLPAVTTSDPTVVKADFIIADAASWDAMQPSSTPQDPK